MGLVARLAAEQVASPSGALPSAAPAVPLYAAKAYAPSSAPSATAPTSAGVPDGQRERGLLGAGQRTGGDTGGPAQRLGGVEPSFGRGAPRPTATTSGALKPAGAGSLVTSPSAPEAPSVSRTSASLPSYALSTASAPGATHGALGALGDTDHDGVGPQAGRGGGAESESSHGGEISLPIEVGRWQWMGPPRGEPTLGDGAPAGGCPPGLRALRWRVPLAARLTAGQERASTS